LEQQYTKDNHTVQVICNFFARGIDLTRSVIAVVDIGNYHDAWALVRMLGDRYIHMEYLSVTGQFVEFAGRTFSETNVQGHKIPHLIPRVLDDYERKAEEYGNDMADILGARLKDPKEHWRRPETRDLLKTAFGETADMQYAWYDFLSSYVHPSRVDADGLGDDPREVICILEVTYQLMYLLIESGAKAGQKLLG
jgi:hypothetical protein